MALSLSLEEYLKAIYILSNTENRCKSNRYCQKTKLYET